MICFFVEGEPKAQPRVKAFRRGNFTGVYTPDVADIWKSRISFKAREYAPLKPIENSIGLKIEFFFERPKNHFYWTKKRYGELKENAPTWKSSKPDIDNFDKAVMDAITSSKKIWKDDSQVVSLFTTKKYISNCEKQGAMITISDLEN